jgi:hypothetical protein
MDAAAPPSLATTQALALQRQRVGCLSVEPAAAVFPAHCMGSVVLPQNRGKRAVCVAPDCCFCLLLLLLQRVNFTFCWLVTLPCASTRVTLDHLL